MKDTGATDYAERAEECDLLIETLVLAISISIGLHISKVANVTHLVIWAGMCLSVRVVVGSRSNTTLGQVTVLVDVEAVSVVRGQA